MPPFAVKVAVYAVPDTVAGKTDRLGYGLLAVFAPMLTGVDGKRIWVILVLLLVEAIKILMAVWISVVPAVSGRGSEPPPGTLIAVTPFFPFNIPSFASSANALVISIARTPITFA